MTTHNSLLKVGVDARLLSRPITGIGRYTLEVCKALCNITDIQLYLYSPSPISLEITKSLGTAIICSSSYHSKIYTQLWSEFVLPLWVKRDKIDVFWGPAHRLPRFLPRSVASVVTIHDLVWRYAGSTMRPSTWILERVHMPAAIKNAQHIVTDAQSTAADVIKEFKIRENKITTIKLGADHLKCPTNINILKNLNILKPYFLFVGTLEPRKNLLNLLKAYSELSVDVQSKVILVIAGGRGWGRLNVEEKIHHLQLVDQVKLIGYVDDETLATLYAYATFMAMPSLYEGFGLPLVEAMSYGIPLLTSNNSSMKEIAESSAILVDPLDVESIKNGLFQLITNDTLHRTLATHAKNNAKQFTWGMTANQLVSVFKQACNA